MRFKTGILAVLLSLPILLCPFSRAFAVTATSGNFEFIETASNQAGLETGDLIATMIGNLTAVTGIGFVNGGLEGSAIKLGETAANNLNALVDSADYPAWDTLDSTTQESWGTKQNYDSAKFNSLMTAFGLGSSLDDFRSSGGANFEFSEDAKDRLSQLGRIGRNWVSGAGNAISTLMGSIVTTDPAMKFTDASSYALVDGSTIDGWPSNAPQMLYVSKGKKCTLHNVGDTGITAQMTLATSNEVYYIPYYTQGSPNGARGAYMFDLLHFNYGSTTTSNSSSSTPSLSSSASTQEFQGNQYYRGGSRNSHSSSAVTCDEMQINLIASNQVNNLQYVIPYLLFSGQLSGIGDYPTITDYPEDLDPESEDPVYYPSNGITGLVNWGDFITQSGGDVDLSTIEALLRQFKFYSTGHLKVHDEGVFDSITDLGTMLTTIDGTLKQILAKVGLGTNTDQVIGDFDFPEFDEKATDLVDTISDLAPFGSLLLISAVVDMAAATGSINDPSLVVPFQFMPGEDYSVTLDFSFLEPLKPVINALLIMVLIMTLANVTLRFVELEAAS